MSQRKKSLVDAVAVLASDPARQLEHLCELGLPDGIDELALEYDAIAAAAGDMLRLGELNKNQYDWIQKLDDLLSRMSSKSGSRLWTAEAISSAPEWKEVRGTAKECLRRLRLSQ